MADRYARDTSHRCGFIWRGYRRDAAYWELAVASRKLALVLVLVLLLLLVLVLLLLCYCC